MGTYPTTPRADFLLWCQAHAPIFTANAVAIGLTPAQAIAFNTAVTAANTSNIASETANTAARAATNANTGNFGDLRRSAAEMVRTIRTYAENKNDPAVYDIAQIPPPAAGTPAPPPAMPTDLTVTVEPGTGAIELAWKASNPVGTTGTSYIVRRKLPGEPDFSFVGVSGAKKFVDNTFFAGPDSVEYTVQGQRADSAGPVSSPLLVRFGRLGGQMVIASQGNGPLNMAA